jgi:hypothetical protein
MIAEILLKVVLNNHNPWLAAGRWLSPGTLVFSTNKTDCHYITDVALKIVTLTLTLTHNNQFLHFILYTTYVRNVLFVSIFFKNNLKVLRILGNTILINTFVSLLKICFFGWDQITSCIYIRSRCTRYNIRWVMKFVSDLWQVDGFFRVLPFPPPIKLTAII